MTSHTPGPWTAVEDNGWWNIEPGVVGIEGCDSGSNASLIAAAPEMLSALENSVRADDAQELSSEEIRDARVAIRKAKAGA